MGANTAKYAVVKYSAAVVEPKATCRSRVLELVCLPPAPNPVMMVATKGPAVISPIFWWVFSMRVRLSSRACSAALLCVSAVGKPKSESEGPDERWREMSAVCAGPVTETVVVFAVKPSAEA